MLLDILGPLTRGLKTSFLADDLNSDSAATASPCFQFLCRTLRKQCPSLSHTIPVFSGPPHTALSISSSQIRHFFALPENSILENTCIDPTAEGILPPPVPWLLPKVYSHCLHVCTSFP